jgi:hypothetical protein
MLSTTAQSPLTFGNHLEILQDANETYPRLLADLRDATESIHLLYYAWASDVFTELVGQLLSEKVALGVRVRILYGPVGSFLMLSGSYVRTLRASGVIVGSNRGLATALSAALASRSVRNLLEFSRFRSSGPSVRGIGVTSPNHCLRVIEISVTPLGSARPRSRTQLLGLS